MRLGQGDELLGDDGFRALPSTLRLPLGPLFHVEHPALAGSPFGLSGRRVA